MFQNKEPELQVSEGGRGYCCLVEKEWLKFLNLENLLLPI